MFKFQLATKTDLREAALIQQRKNFEEDRKSRIFNARKRIIGVSITQYASILLIPINISHQHFVRLILPVSINKLPPKKNNKNWNANNLNNTKLKKNVVLIFYNRNMSICNGYVRNGIGQRTENSP